MLHVDQLATYVDTPAFAHRYIPQDKFNTLRPLTCCEDRVPQAQRPEQYRDEILNPAMQACRISWTVRDMWCRRVHEHPYQDVHDDSQSYFAEQCPEKIHGFPFKDLR